MLRDLVTLVSGGAVSYLWLSAIASPLGTSLRSLVRSAWERTAWSAFGLAVAGAVLWTAAVAAVFLVGRLAGAVALPLTDLVWVGVSLGNIVWACQLLAFARAPRLGPTFEIGTALAIVAFVHDDPWTLARVERLYRSHALAGMPEPVASGPLVSGHVRRVAA